MTISVGIFVIGNEFIGQKKSIFLSHPVDGLLAVWWYRNSAFHDGSMLGTTSFCGSVCVIVRGAFLLNVKSKT